MRREYISETCEVICEDNGRKMVADVLNFREHQYLTVSLEKELKLNLQWNNNVYEGRLGRMSFVSEGPVITPIKKGR